MDCQKIVLCLLSMALLTSCASRIYRQAEKKHQEITHKTTDFLAAAENKDKLMDYSIVKINNQNQYVGTVTYRPYDDEVLPVRVEADGVTIVSSQLMGLSALAKLIYQATSLPVLVEKDLANGKDSGSNNASVSIYQKLANGVQNGTGNNSDNQDDYNTDRMSVNYHGPLSQFLNSLAAHFNIAWSYSNGVIVFSKYISRTFAINTLPVKMNSSSSLSIGGAGGGSGGDSGGGSGGGSGGSGGGSGDSSSGGSGGGGATHSSSQQVTLDIWKDINASLKTILGSQGTYNISESLSTLTVSTTPTVMKRISDYITELNRQLEKQVTVNVSVYRVDLDNDSKWGFSLKAVVSALGGKITGTIKDEFAAAQPFISMKTKNGSTIDVSLLDDAGKVSVVTSAAVTTMSGRPVPLQVTNSRGYLSSITKTITNDTTSLSSNTDTVSAGFGLDLLPKVLDNGQILLQYGINISSLDGPDDGFNQVKVGDDTLQLLNMNQRAFIQESLLNNAQTLVLAGFENVESKTDDKGTGDASFKWLGGEKDANGKRQLLVICITPRIISLSGE